jgi:glycerophosphoryl diester phosphodiesterase
LKWWLIAVCAVSVFVSGPQRFEQFQWMLNTDYGTAMIMAHRGYSAQAPENTIPAFQMCIDNRFTAAELDVQMLADGTVVVLHDDNLKRTTGVDKNVWEVTYDDIKDLDNGSFFDKSFAGTTIPTFDEVMKLAGHGKDKLYLNIEIKRNGHDDGIVEEVVKTIREYNYMDYCDVTSQDYETLEEVRRVDPEILTAYTSAIGIGDLDKLEAADIISIQETFATYENIDRIHRAGKHVFVWTVNEEDTMKRLVSLNVDAILTNDPALCRSVIDQYDSNIMNIVQRIHSAFSFL